MADIGALLDLINGYAANGDHAAAHGVRNVGEHPRFHGGLFRNRDCWAAALCTFIRPLRARYGRWPWIPALKRAEWGAGLSKRWKQKRQQNNLHALFAFTYVPEFFRKVGFREVERGELPLKVWKDCLRCPKFQCCDEIAVVKALRPDPVLDVGIGTGNCFDPASATESKTPVATKLWQNRFAGESACATWGRRFRCQPRVRPVLFIAQRGHGIDARGTVGGNVAGQQG